MRLIAGTRELLAELAGRVDSQQVELLEELVTIAHAAVVLGEQPPRELERRFVARVRELADQAQHPRPELTTSFGIGRGFVDGIRQLRDGLELPRMDLVVDYLVRAAWELVPEPPEGDDELARRRWLGSYNLHSRLFPPRAESSPAEAVNQAQLALFAEDEPATS